VGVSRPLFPFSGDCPREVGGGVTKEKQQTTAIKARWAKPGAREAQRAKMLALYAKERNVNDGGKKQENGRREQDKPKRDGR
jgi:hypothetical protein